MNTLVVGATSTVAGDVATHLAARGDRIFCIGRSPKKMARLMKSLGGAAVGNACFDFDKEPMLIEEALEKASTELGTIDLVLVAHGALYDQLESEVSIKAAQMAFETNFLSVLRFLIPLANLMEKEGHGKIAVITSVAGVRGRPRNYTYGSAKGALSLYLEGLRSRLWSTGVEVYDFKLGPVDTPMTKDHAKNFSFSTPEKVAKTIFAGLKTKRYVRYVPGFWGLVMIVVKYMPEVIFQRLSFLSGR